MSPDFPAARIAFENALSEPTVQKLAGLLGIDLDNEAVRNRVLAQAEDNFHATPATAAATTPADDGQAAVTAQAPPEEIPLYRIEQALQSYREIASI